MDFDGKSICELFFAKVKELVGRVFTNDPGDWSSIPGRVISKTLKIVLA